MIDLEDYGLLTIFAAGLTAIVAAGEIGRVLGAREVGRGGVDVSTLEGATLGLLALMIGFTFAMALSRFEARRDAIVNEANAISTTALRARLLPTPNRLEMVDLLREYAEARLEATRSALNAQVLKAAVVHSSRLQEALWQRAAAVAAKNAAVVPTGIFIQSLNEMIDNQTKHLVAIQNRVPNIVFLALYSVAIRCLHTCRLCQWASKAAGAASGLFDGSDRRIGHLVDSGSRSANRRPDRRERAADA